MDDVTHACNRSAVHTRKTCELPDAVHPLVIAGWVRPVEGPFHPIAC